MIRDLLGDSATDSLLGELQPFLESIQRLGWKEMKPWGEFFATFKAPQMTAKHLEQRITTNFLFYRSNYLALCCGVVVLQVLWSPMIVLSSLAVLSIWTYLMTVYQKPLVVGEVTFDSTGKQWLCAALSLVVLFVTGTMEKLLWTALYCIFLCTAHMIFRPRNVSSKSNRVYEEMKLSGYGFFAGAPSGGYDSKYEGKYEGKDLEEPGTGYDSKYAEDADMRMRSAGGGSGKYDF